MNMTVTHDVTSGTLMWSSLLYLYSRATIRAWDYEAVFGVSVGHVYALMIDNGRDKYEMFGGGSGCRFWV